MTDDESSSSTSQKISIAGNVFKAVKTVNLSKEVTLCKRRVQDQTEMADHASKNPVIFEFELELLNDEDEYDVLDSLREAMSPFDLVTRRGQYSNMIITKLSDRETGQQSSTTSATITVEQVLIGTVSTAVVKLNTDALPVDVTTVAEEAYPGSSTLKYTVIDIWPSTVAPEQTEGETIVQHCDGLTAKIDSLRSMNRMVPTV